jgi:hypothetical protein
MVAQKLLKVTATIRLDPTLMRLLNKDLLIAT